MRDGRGLFSRAILLYNAHHKVVELFDVECSDALVGVRITYTTVVGQKRICALALRITGPDRPKWVNSSSPKS